MMRRILAIDPGASGGVVELYPNGTAIAVAMPDDAELCEIVRSFAKSAIAEGEGFVCYLELVGGFIAGSKLPGSAMFNFGDGYGYIRGLLAACLVETRLIRPQDWQTGIPGVRGTKEKPARKRLLKEHAARLFPALKVTLKTSDALCLADYARRMEGAAIR